MTTNEENSYIEKTENSPLKEVLLFIKDIIVIVAIVLVLQRFIVIPFMINGQSMSSSYYDKEFIIVDRISYLLGAPHRGDVIVFKPGVNKNKEYFLKRIIGIPGDKVKIVDGKVFVKTKDSQDFKELDETYLNSENVGNTYVGTTSREYIYELQADQFFVMGDNRTHSTDSRECFGNCIKRNHFIHKDDMIGKVFIDLGYFDFSKIKFIHPELGVDTFPRFFSSPANHNYIELQ